MDQEKTPQQSVPPGELEHLEQILRMVNEELEEAQRSVDKMDDEYKEAQQYIADSHGEGDPKEMFQTRMLMGQIDNRGASAVVYRDRLKKTKSSPRCPMSAQAAEMVPAWAESTRGSWSPGRAPLAAVTVTVSPAPASTPSTSISTVLSIWWA